MNRRVKSPHLWGILGSTYKLPIKIYVQYALLNPPLRSGRVAMRGCVRKICEGGGAGSRTVQNSSYSSVSALCLHTPFLLLHTDNPSVAPVHALDTHA